MEWNGIELHEVGLRVGLELSLFVSTLDNLLVGPSDWTRLKEIRTQLLWDLRWDVSRDSSWAFHRPCWPIAVAGIVLCHPCDNAM